MTIERATSPQVTAFHIVMWILRANFPHRLCLSGREPPSRLSKREAPRQCALWGFLRLFFQVFAPAQEFPVRFFSLYFSVISILPVVVLMRQSPPLLVSGTLTFPVEVSVMKNFSLFKLPVTLPVVVLTVMFSPSEESKRTFPVDEEASISPLAVKDENERLPVVTFAVTSWQEEF